MEVAGERTRTETSGKTKKIASINFMLSQRSPPFRTANPFVFLHQSHVPRQNTEVCSSSTTMATASSSDVDGDDDKRSEERAVADTGGLVRNAV